MSSFKPIPTFQPRFRRWPEDVSTLVSLADWAAQNHWSVTYARELIHKNEIVAYKSGGRWWVDTRFPRVPRAKYAG